MPARKAAPASAPSPRSDPAGDPDRLRQYLRNLAHLPAQERAQAATRLAPLMMRTSPVEDARERFLPYVRRVWPGFVHGGHHNIMAKAFERIVRGELKRVIINLPPRHTKSKFASVLFPGWFLGHYPERKILEASHTASLAMDFGRELRNLIATPEYQEIFPGVSLAPDARAAGRWNTTAGGMYFAVGSSGAAAGRGGDLVVIDDPHSEQDVLANSKAAFEKVWKWYTSGPRQRLQPDAAILIVMTRWGELDLTGQLLRQLVEGDLEEDWELIELAAIIGDKDGAERSLWPEYWSLSEMQRTRAILPAARWAAQYQQKPTSDQGAIIKREWWQNWQEPEPPKIIDFAVQAWDTAFSSKDTACRSACITWGVFRLRQDDKVTTGIILLDAWAGRIDFPDLKKKARELHDWWKPAALIIEKKASGGPLIQELQRAGIWATELNPSRFRDKVARTNAVADLFRSGAVWAPLNGRWVQQVVEEMTSFPHGEYDDLHDAAVWGLLHIRENPDLIRIASDEEEEEWKPRPPRHYY
jgi:predicted phage terminase large subunit-like protein